MAKSISVRRQVSPAFWLGDHINPWIRLEEGYYDASHCVCRTRIAFPSSMESWLGMIEDVQCIRGTSSWEIRYWNTASLYASFSTHQKWRPFSPWWLPSEDTPFVCIFSKTWCLTMDTVDHSRGQLHWIERAGYIECRIKEAARNIRLKSVRELALLNTNCQGQITKKN